MATAMVSCFNSAPSFSLPAMKLSRERINRSGAHSSGAPLTKPTNQSLET